MADYGQMNSPEQMYGPTFVGGIPESSTGNEYFVDDLRRLSEKDPNILHFLAEKFNLGIAQEGVTPEAVAEAIRKKVPIKEAQHEIWGLFPRYDFSPGDSIIGELPRRAIRDKEALRWYRYNTSPYDMPPPPPPRFRSSPAPSDLPPPIPPIPPSIPIDPGGRGGYPMDFLDEGGAVNPYPSWREGPSSAKPITVPNLPMPTVPISTAAAPANMPPAATAAPVRTAPYQGRPGMTYSPDAGMEMAARQRPTRRGGR